MTTQQQLDDLTYTIGENLREAWLKGYAEALRKAQEILLDRTSYASEQHKQGLEIALALIKEESN